MASQYRVLFAGGILEGYDKAAVKQAAAARLKLSSAQMETIFSGQKIILKKGLSAEEASRYGSALEKIGMRIRVQKVVTEAVVAAPASTSSPDIWPPVDANLPRGGIGQRPAAAAPAPQSEPEYDPEKTHIYTPAAVTQLYAEPLPKPVAPAPQPPARPLQNQGAGTSIDARAQVPTAPIVDKIAAQAPVESPPAASRNMANLPAAAKENTAAQNAAESSVLQITDTQETAEDPPLLGMGFAGRLGRVGFLIGSLVVKSAVILLVLTASILGKIGLLGALAIGGIAGLYFLLRLAVLRLHDLGMDGRLCLLAFIPGLNLLAYLYWIFFPGNRSVNRYGAPGSTAGIVPVLITLAVFAGIVTAAVFLFPRDLLHI